MSRPLTGGGLLLVHAHPDDESIGTGATMAMYAARGIPVTLVTCTLGELGEIIPPELTHLAANGGHALGEHRLAELDAACAALGVTDHRFLGGAGRWRDSGMMGFPGNEDPRCFWRADVDVAAAQLVSIIREVRPRVMVSYDSNGFYGHPDHIQAHRVALRAFQLAADASYRAAPATHQATAAAASEDAPWHVAKFYATAMPHSILMDAIILAGAAGDGDGPARFSQVASIHELPFGVPDDQVTTDIDASAFLDAKAAAMRAHTTQIVVDGPFFALSNLVGQRITGHEYYTLLAGPRGPAADGGWEDDLFAGLDER